MIRLFPKEEQFLPLFARAAATVVEAAKALDALAGEFRDVEVRVAQIKHLEHEGDQITHGAFTLLGRTWITPIDREDIHSLVSAIDDVLDDIDTVAGRLTLFKIDSTTPHMKAATQLILQSAVAIQRAVSQLGDMKESDAIIEACVEVKRLESEADTLNRIAIGSLFESSKDPIEILKWKEIYEVLERATDRCEDVANVIEQIVLKAS